MANLPESFEFQTPVKTETVAVEGFKLINSEHCGIYVFRGKSGDCIYVGQTKSFRSRLASHLAKSPFSRLIYAADLYCVNDPYIREVFETVFIDKLRPHYNRAKSFPKQRARHDAILYKIVELEAERDTLDDERAEIMDAVDRPEDYDLYDDYTDYDEGLRYMLGEDLRMVERIPEIDAEIKRVGREISRLYTKVSKLNQ